MACGISPNLFKVAERGTKRKRGESEEAQHPGGGGEEPSANAAASSVVDATGTFDEEFLQAAEASFQADLTDFLRRPEVYTSIPGLSGPPQSLVLPCLEDYFTSMRFIM